MRTYLKNNALRHWNLHVAVWSLGHRILLIRVLPSPHGVFMEYASVWRLVIVYLTLTLHSLK